MTTPTPPTVPAARGSKFTLVFQGELDRLLQLAPGPAELRIFWHLVASTGYGNRLEDVQIKRLAATLHMDRKTAGTAMAALEAKKVIARRPDPHTGRVVVELNPWVVFKGGILERRAMIARGWARPTNPT